METINYTNEQYIKNLYSRFALNEKEFEISIYYQGLTKIISGIPNIDIEAMDLKDLVDELINENNITDVRWKRFSFCLRRVAQKLYIKHAGIVEDKRFLKVVK